MGLLAAMAGLAFSSGSSSEPSVGGDSWENGVPDEPNSRTSGALADRMKTCVATEHLNVQLDQDERRIPELEARMAI